MKKLLIIPFCLLCSCLLAQPKEIKPADFNTLQKYEDSLQQLFVKIRTSGKEEDRFDANYEFIPLLVEALKTPNSYYYPFDSLENVSIIETPDRKFRVFTWMVIDQDERLIERWTYKYFGAIQFNQSGELRLIPLLDKSAEIGAPETKTLDAKNWYGALYYDLTPYEHKGKTYYLLFGWDGFNHRTDKKLVDIMHFNGKGEPIFGHPVFWDKDDREKMKLVNRFFLEFKQGSVVNLNYDDLKKSIIFDFLVPESEDAAKSRDKSQYIPDGSYRALELKDGEWKYVDKVFTESPLLESFVQEKEANQPSAKAIKKAKKRSKKKRKKRKRR